MSRQLGAFLSLFSLLGLIMRMDAVVFVFGTGALMLLAIDLVVTPAAGKPHKSENRSESTI